MLVLSRAAQGVGAALAAPGVLALLTTSAPDEAARNRALALFGAVSSAGMSLGLLLGGVVTDLGSWRWTLFINIPIGLAVLSLTRRFLDETPRRPGRFDLVGGKTLVAWPTCGRPSRSSGSPTSRPTSRAGTSCSGRRGSGATSSRAVWSPSSAASFVTELKVVLLTEAQLRGVVEEAPGGFGARISSAT